MEGMAQDDKRVGKHDYTPGVGEHKDYHSYEASLFEVVGDQSWSGKNI